MAQKVKTYDFLFKIVFIGDAGTGKTSLITRFADGIYTSTPYTMGIDFKIKTVEVNGKRIKLQVWDTAGGERWRTITASYFRGTTGCVLVYDIANEKTFDNMANNWLKQIREQGEDNLVTMLLGNKCDLEEERMVSKERGEEFAKENGMKFLETSAKDNINVEEALMSIAADILEKYPKTDTGSSGVVKPDTKQNSRSRCF